MEIEKELREALNGCDWRMFANKPKSDRCEGCNDIKLCLFVSAEKEETSSNFALCISCIAECSTKEFANACKMSIMKDASKERYEEQRKLIVTNITEEIDARYPQLKRNLDLFLDGQLRLSDGKDHETLSDIYRKTIARSKIPSESQVKLFNSICSNISAMKNQGMDYKEKYDGVEVDNLIAGLSVATLQEKHAEPFVNIKKWYVEKGWVTMKQLNFLKVMDDAKKI